MSLITPWGYTFKTATALGDLITVDEFNTRTANKYAGDTRIAPAIASASQGLRDSVGWHLSPSEACVLKTTFFDNRVAVVNRGIHIQLPARYVTGVTSVKIDDKAYTTYVLETNGLLKVYGVPFVYFPQFADIEIEYTAGLPEGLVNTLKDLAVNRVTKVLAQSYGVQSETAGGLSISYSAAWASDASASTLTAAEEAALAPYKLRGVF